MPSKNKPESLRDTLSVEPSQRDKLSSRLRSPDRPNCFNHKGLPFEAVGIVHALPTQVGPTPERRASL